VYKIQNTLDLIILHNRSWNDFLLKMSMSLLQSLSRQSLYQTCIRQTRTFLSNTKTDNKNKGGFFDKIRETLEERNKKSQMDKYSQQLSDMADRETFDLDAFGAQVDASQLSGWRSMIPGINNTAAIKGLKDTQKLIQATKDILGSHVTITDLRNMDKKQKLLIAIQSEQTPEDINAFLEVFSSLHVMHRILRYRKLKGLSIPKDEATAKVIFASDVSKVLSPQEIRAMRRSRAQSLGVKRH